MSQHVDGSKQNNTAINSNQQTAQLTAHSSQLNFAPPQSFHPIPLTYQTVPYSGRTCFISSQIPPFNTPLLYHLLNPHRAGSAANKKYGDHHLNRRSPQPISSRSTLS